MTVTTLTEASTSRFVTTKPYKVHYHEAGEGHPVICLHGSGPGASAWSNFNANIGPLAARHRVLAIDMPGWGKSDTWTAEKGLDASAALLAVMDELQIEKAALVGNSMGGMTAVRFTVEHPERVSHLIPMGVPSPGVSVFTPGGGMSEGLKILLATYMEPTKANFKKLVQVMCYDQAYATDELSEQRSAAALAVPEHLASFISVMSNPGPAMMSFFQLGPQLETLPVPTMVVHGRDDRTVPYENALRLVSLIPDSRLVLFNRCGHWAQLEHAEEFNRLVAHYINGD
jgi:2-hydroxy-6-oxonona-2,4-dienedioate hydrolase